MYPRRQTPIQNTLRSVSLLVLLAFGANASGQVNGTAPLASDSGVTTLEQDGFSGGVSLNGTYFDVRHQAGKGVGYSSDGFTQFGLFTPFWGSSDNWFIAPNARVNLTNDSRSGFNAGLVSRLYSEQFDRIVGVNAYWDNDKSQLNNRYDQVGFGFETLGPILDFRANAYVPTTNESNFVRATGLSSDIAFFGNRLGLIGTQIVESALKGYDFEFGVPLTPSTPWLRGYAGMYAYQQSSGTDPVGFRGRVEGWVSNDTSLGFMVTQDKHFGTNVNATVDWRFAGFKPTRYFPNFSTRDRMLMPVQRSWRITASQYEEEVKVLADNPRTGNNYFVVWVDPDRLATKPGAGTYENPYTDLPANVPNQTDLLLVRRGDTTAANPLNGQIALPNNTRLLGEGFAHVFDATATFGGVTRYADDRLLREAGFQNTGLYPFLTNTGGDTVRVANGNEVAAFVMDGAAGAAITGTNVRGFHFHHLEITNNAGGGIVLPDAGGTGLVTPDGQTILGARIADINRNLVNGWANPAGLGNNGGPGGIVVGTGIAPLDLAIERVSMNATPGGQQYGVRLRTAQGALNTRINDLSTSGGNVEAGLSIEQTTGPIAANINLLQSSDNDGNGLRLLTGSQRTMRVDGTNITANRNGGDNLRIADNPVLAALPHNVTFDGLFSNSSFDDSVNGNGVSLNMTNGIKSLSLTDVSASGNALSGVDLVSTGGTLNFNANRLNASDNTGHNLNALLSNTRFTGVATDSVFDRSLATGVRLDATGGQSSLLLNRVSVSQNQRGLVVNGHANAQIGNAANAVFDGVSVIDSTLTGNTFDAINTLAEGNSHIELFVDPTDLSGSGRHAFRFDVQSSSDLVAFLDQTNFDNSGQNPGHVEQGRAVFGFVDGIGSLADVTIQDSTLRNAADDGLFVRATNGSQANVSLADVTITDSGRTQAGASGIEVNALSGSTINLDITGVTHVDNSVLGGPGAFGLTVVSRDIGSVVNATATGTTFDNAGVNAVDVLVDAGVATVTLTGTTFNDAGVNAVNLLVDNAGVATVTLTDTIGDRAGASGLNALVSNTGFLTLELQNADFFAAGQNVVGDGLNAVVNTGGILNACIKDSNFDFATGAGLRFLSTGPNSVASVHFENGTANLNDQGGLVATADAGGALYLRTTAANFDFNGGAGLADFDGVFVRANGLGSEALMLFDNTTADGNSRHGFNFEAAGGAVLTSRLDTISASNNGGFGVRLDATGAGTGAILLPSGTNTVAGNTLGSYSLNYAGVNLAVVALNGSFNGVAGDGVHVDINNVGTAVVSVTGNGTTDTIDGNLGDGVDIRISNANSAGVRIAGYNSISNNTGDGVHLELTNIATAAAVEVLGVAGQTAMTNNGDEGVDVTLTNVALGTFVPPVGLNPLRIIPLVNVDPTICFPVPIDVPFGTFVTIPASDGILIDNLNISQIAAPAGHNGIAVAGTNVTGGGTVTLTNNTIARFDNGISATFGGGSNFGGLVIDNTAITNSAISGINVGLNASTVPLSITNTDITTSGGTGLNVTLTNVIGGADITLDTVNVRGSGGSGVRIAGTGVLDDVSLTDVSARNSNGGDGVALVLTGGSVDTIRYDNVSSRVSGGNGVRVDLNGITNVSSVVVDGAGTAVANNSTLDGVLVSLVNVTGVPDVAVGNYGQVNVNGGHGINLTALGTNLHDVDLSDNTVNNSTLDGLHLVLNSIIGGQITMANNVVNISGNDGIQLLLDNVTGNPDVTVMNSTVTASGGFGITLTASNAALGNILLDPIQVTGSGADGVLVGLANTSATSVVLDQVSVDTSVGRGINVDLNTVNSLTNVAVTGPALVQRSGSDGIRINMNNMVTGMPDVTVTGQTVDRSTGRGIAVISGGSRVDDVTVSNNIVTNSTAGQGVQVNLTGSQVGSLTIASDTISDSSNRGLDVILDNVTGPPVINLNNIAVLRSGGRGVSVEGSTATLGRVTLNTVSSGDGTAGSGTTAGEGVAVIFDTNSTTGSIDLNNVSATNSFAGGILVDLNAVTMTGANPRVFIDGQNTAQSTNNGGDGILMNLTNVVGATTRPDLSIINYLLVDQNAGPGIALDTNGSGVDVVTVSNNIVSNSTAGDGIEVDLSGSLVTSLTIGNDTISDSSGRGLDVLLDNVTGSPTITIANIGVLRSGGRGVSVDGSTAVVGNVFLSNVSSGDATAGSGTTANEGVAVIFDTASTTGSIRLNDVSAQQSATRGILVDLNAVTMTGVNPIVLIDGQNTAQSTNNGGDGILMNLTNVVGATTRPDLSIINYLLVDQNAGRGIALDTNGSGVDVVTVSNNIVTNSTAGDGIEVDLTGSLVTSLTIADDQISDSFGRGLDVILDNVTGAPAINLTDIAVLRSGGRGVSVDGSTALVGNVTLTNVSSGDGIAGSGTTANEGVAVIFDTASTTGSIALNNVSAQQSAAGGVLVDLNNVTLTGANPFVLIDGQNTAQSTNNGGDGIFLNLTAITGTPDASVINYLLVDTNAGRGIGVDSNGALLDDVTVSNNIVSNSTNGQGIQVQLAVSTLDTLVVSDNTVSDTTALLIGQGIQIDLTGSTLLTSLVADNDNVTNSADRGIDIILNGTLSAPTITLSNSSVTNSGGRGVSLDGNGAVLGDVTLSNVSSTLTTAGEGVVLNLNAGTVGSVLLDTVSANQSFAGGIRVSLLGGENVGPSITLNGQGTAISSNNGGDGILVDLIVNGAPDVTISDYAFVDTNAGRGIALQTNASTVGAINASNNIVSNSTAGQGMHLNLTGSQVGSVLVDSNQISDSFGRGLDVVLNNTSGFPGIAISNTTVTNSGDRGVSVGGTGALLGDVTLTNVSSDTTLANEGVAVDLDNGTVGSIVMNNVSADASFTTGILVDLNTQTVGPEITLNGMGAGHVTGNGTGVAGDGIWITLNTLTGTPNLTVSDYLSIDTNAGDGVIVQQVTAADVGTVNIANNIINANDTNGVVFLSNNSNTGVVTLTENQITGQVTGDGVHVGPVGDLDNSLDFAFFRNTITTNAGDGVNVVLPVPGLLNPTLNLSFTNDTISNNTGNGILVDLTAAAGSAVNANVSILSSNAVGGANPISGNNFSDISNNGTVANGGMGLFIDSSLVNVANANNIVLTTGGTGGLNLFNRNHDAGIGIELGSFSTLRTNVAGSSFTNTINGGLPIYNGDGVSIVMTDNSQYTNSTFNNMTFTGNAGSGFSLQTTNAAFANSLTFSNSTFSNNTTNGLLFSRNSTVPNNGFIQNISLANNQINDNNVGINILSQFAPTTDTFSITNNTINSNNSHGIQLNLTADANIGLVLNTNFITNNGGDGINARANYGATDAGEYAIQSNNDTITGNTGDGVDVIAIHNVSFNNATISRNVTGNGVSLNGTNTLAGNPFSVTPFGGATTNVALVGNSITNSFVDDNGAAGIVMTNQGAMFINIGTTQVNRNGADGIDLLNSGSMTSQLMTATLNQNFIGANGGDGIQYAGVGTGGSIVGNPGTLTAVNSYANQFAVPFLGNNNLAFTNNTLQANRARGINVLNGGNIATDLNISSNIIDRSQLEGVYIVNTAATAQNVDANANAAMATGDALADPRLGLTVFNNQITSNGQIQTAASVFDTTGLVIRVGTSDASNSIRDNGGFASATGVTNANVLANGGLISQMGRGGVQALVRNNTLGGNYAADVTFQGFVSTTNPATSAGQWTDNNDGTNPPPGPPTAPRNNGNDIFRVDSYVSDPLSRLDLVFSNNTGNALRATRGDAASILYNNAEDVFKSRTKAQDGADFPVGGFNQSNVNNGDDGGPFDSGSRARNATRLADNTGAFNAPVGVGSVVDVQNAANGFLFSGVSGFSTFRRSSPGALGFPLVSAGFGATVSQGAGVGENTFKWDAFP